MKVKYIIYVFLRYGNQINLYTFYKYVQGVVLVGNQTHNLQRYYQLRCAASLLWIKIKIIRKLSTQIYVNNITIVT